jgi:threonine dehydrogenase-like Zn-dependent dehydrogenase
LHFYSGGFKGPDGLNKEFIAGHEFAGVISEVGENIRGDWKVGDRVVTDNTAGACGVCSSCAKGHFVNCSQRKTLGLGTDGGFAKYVRIPGEILALNPNSIFHLPDNMDFAAATVLEPAANAYRVIVQEAQVKPGETVVVYGPGPIGLMCVQIAKIVGAAKIILVGQSIGRDVRSKIGLQYGATHWIENDHGVDIKEQIAEIAGEGGVDVVIDAVGHPIILPEALDIVKNEGIVIRAGLNEKPVAESINTITVKAVKLFGHMGYDTECWKNCIRLVKVGLLDLNTIVTHQLKLEDWEEGFKRSIDNSAGKVVLIP